MLMEIRLLTMLYSGCISKTRWYCSNKEGDGMKTLEQAKQNVQDAVLNLTWRYGSYADEFEYDGAVIEAVDFLLHINGMSHRRANGIILGWVAEIEQACVF